MSSLDIKALERACAEVRGLSMDAVAKAASGHLGLPLGATELGAVLYGGAMRYHPDKHEWLNRDVFVLSAGHGSMFLYSWLHISGFKLPIEEIKNFRQLNSATPGHPEFFHTKGVEATTGPLGQGVGNAVGYAVAAKMAEGHFNTSTHKIFDNQKIICLAGDGCLQEGISAEASAFAGHHKLDNLIIFYDSNDVTLDAMAVETQSEDTGKRYEAYGFEVQTVKEGNSIQAISQAYEKAKSSKSGKPQFIILKTLIGKGIPEVAGTNKAHGEGGVKFVDAARKALGLPEEKFFVSQETKKFFQEHKAKLQKDYEQWEKVYNEWRSANPQLATQLDNAKHAPKADELFAKIPKFAEGSIATRKAGSDVLQPIAQAVPLFISGSADLHGSTLNYIKDGKDFTPKEPAGRNIKFGIREHAMGAMLNGIAYHGIFRPSGATFLVFSDYLRPSIRLSAVSNLPVVYIFTHDSAGVGEDGPTHQPIETVSGLRLVPNLDVIRPADPEETAGAFVAALERNNGPTLLALSRQAVPLYSDVDVNVRRQGALKGAYVLYKEKGDLRVIIIGSGSEVSTAVEAAKKIGDGVRVVSMPCPERFERQTAEYKDSVLPNSCRKRVAVEAGVPGYWFKYVGLDGRIVGIDRWGVSAPGAQALKYLGITADHVVEVAKSII